MKKLTSLSVVLLAYHEENVIENNVLSIQNTVKALCNEHEIIVVGFEGCKDKTNDIVRDLSKSDPRIRLVVQPKDQKGYGRAYAIGLLAARYDWIFQSDADGQYLFDDIALLVEKVTDKVDVVHGYRRKRNDPKERLVMAFCYNLALKFMYGLPVKDVDSAFKLIRRSSLEGLPLKSFSGFCVTESLIRIKARGGKIIQLPITHLPRSSGEALAEKGIKNPFNLQLPNYELVSGTLGEAIKFWLNYKNEIENRPQLLKSEH